MRTKLHGTWPSPIPTKGQEGILQAELGLLSASDWLCDLERIAVLLWAQYPGLMWLASLSCGGACSFPLRRVAWEGHHIPQAPSPALILSVSATGPLEERQIAYVCREALKVQDS